MSAAGESRLCIVIATCGEGQRIAELEAEIEDLQRQALALGAEPTADFAPWVLLGVKIDQCPHSAEGDECGRDARFPSNHGLAESSVVGTNATCRHGSFMSAIGARPEIACSL
jgi:hypothetical protein